MGQWKIEEAESFAQELFEKLNLVSGNVLVVGCSTSEIHGAKIGKAGSPEIALNLFKVLSAEAEERKVWLAFQCCEHLNRALVVEREAMEAYGLEEVSVHPVEHAGGALAAQAMQDFVDPVVVEAIAAHGGIDIGATLIGMHLKKVAVPLRLQQKTIGQAMVTAAWTRPKLIGGSRAVYK